MHQSSQFRRQVSVTNRVNLYEGYSSCPLVTGYGKMVLAEQKNVRSDPFLSKFVAERKLEHVDF